MIHFEFSRWVLSQETTTTVAEEETTTAAPTTTETPTTTENPANFPKTGMIFAMMMLFYRTL